MNTTPSNLSNLRQKKKDQAKQGCIMLNYTPNFNHETTSTGEIYGQNEAIIQAVCLGIIIAFGVAGNVYICKVFFNNRNLRNPTFVFLANLAVANIGALILCTPFPLVNSIQRRFNLQRHWCILNGFLNNFFFFISIFTLSVIASQNYFTIVKPSICAKLQIRQNRTKFHLFGLWGLCFIFSFISIDPFNNWSHVVFNPTTAHCGLAFPVTLGEKLKLTVLALIAFIIPICGMSFAFFRIYLKVRSHEQRVLRNLKERNIAALVTKKLAITLSLMFGTFVICWLPFFLLISLSVVYKDPSKLPWILGRLAYWCGYLNCAINPSLYCLRSTMFKDVLRRPSSTTTELTIKRLAMSYRRRRAFSLPAITTGLKRPRKTFDRQSYPQIGQDYALKNFEAKTINVNEARLRAFSCSSYEIKETGENSRVKGTCGIKTRLNPSKEISIGEVTFESHCNELAFGQLHTKMGIHASEHLSIYATADTGKEGSH